MIDLMQGNFSHNTNCKTWTIPKKTMEFYTETNNPR